ncbi:MmcQ/YjbR family DNA-binding protein [Mycetocola spongiae]|uniref:MmcQ/YjbR family DNA-binding protein n=1 Tax=Mycetocola spongiae TaxID=2859226 RepID=UPI001CF54412|nr:MmcQ/YjbR family DNA-binding protein [Mycetocola spongiae]UCR89888.1 MmcQ/YjbR family DNA-binding protein [Mycetocola spongiae]
MVEDIELALYERWDADLLSRPGSEASYPFMPGARVYKVLGKMFALLSEEHIPLRLNLKGDPIRNQFLCRDYPAITPGYHMNKTHWISVHLDGTVPDELLENLIDESYRLVAAGLARAEKIRLAALGG